MTRPALVALVLALTACDPAPPAAGGVDRVEADLIEADRVESVSDSAPLGLSATAEIDRDTLRFSLAVLNRSRRAVRIGYGACSASLDGWPNAQRVGPPAFRTAWWRPPPHPDAPDALTAVGCPAYLAEASVAAGGALTDARELRGSYPVREVLLDSLPDGRYWLTASFDLAGPPDTLRVDLGPLVVARGRP